MKRKTEKEWRKLGLGLGNRVKVTKGTIQPGDMLVFRSGYRMFAEFSIGAAVSSFGMASVYRPIGACAIKTDWSDIKIPVQQDGDAVKPKSSMPSDAAERKTYPIATGVLSYFPDAIAAIAHVSFVGNEQHNPGTPLHWDRSKSTDEADALMRHFMERGKMDTDGLRHTAKMAWRALALLQKELEANCKQVSD